MRHPGSQMRQKTTIAEWNPKRNTTEKKMYNDSSRVGFSLNNSDKFLSQKHATDA